MFFLFYLYVVGCLIQFGECIALIYTNEDLRNSISDKMNLEFGIIFLFGTIALIMLWPITFFNNFIKRMIGRSQ